MLFRVKRLGLIVVCVWVCVGVQLIHHQVSHLRVCGYVCVCVWVGGHHQRLQLSRCRVELEYGDRLGLRKRVHLEAFRKDTHDCRGLPKHLE